MKYHKQLIPVHDEKNGLYGDCYRTVIACLLDIDPEDVPHVCDGISADNNDADNIVTKRMDAFLEQFGLYHMEFSLGDAWNLDEILEYAGHYFRNYRYTLLGKSTSGSFNHIVICKGNKIVHSTNDSSVEGPCINGSAWFVGFLAKRV